MADKKEKKADENAPEAEAKSGGMMGLIALVFAAVAGSFGANYLLAPSSAPAATTAEACPPTAEHVAEVKPVATEDQEFVELEEFLITIGSAPATRYLKMQVSVVTDKEAAPLVKESEPILVDAFINYLRSVELADFEDPGFYAHMREQLSRRSELVVGSAASDGVLITEFLLR